MVASEAMAGFWIEPQAGYSVAGTRYEYVADHPDSSLAGREGSASITGMTFGARLGYAIGRIMIGGEYQAFSGRKAQNGGASSAADFTSNAVYATIGLRVWGPIRAMAAFTLNQTAEDKGSPATRFGGGGPKAGLSVDLLSRLALNLEYNIVNLKSVEQSGRTYRISDLYTRFDFTAWSVSLSLPFDLTSSPRR